MPDPTGVSRYTSSDADLLKAFARADFPKFALHMPSDCALDKWDEALKEAIKLAKRLKDGDGTCMGGHERQTTHNRRMEKWRKGVSVRCFVAFVLC